ncbi:MAG: manganese efflux pump [Clostridia bacterium]|nr:manganese efflux pump [Clostridia bacterium]
MQLLEIFLLSVGLAADAFAVSVCKGLSVVQMKPKHALICGVYFGSFQAFMPLIGYWAGKAATTLVSGRFDDSIVETVCAVIAFILLAIIGGNMIRESLSKDDDDECSDCFKPKTMIPMAIATSIDAFAVGVALALDEAASGEINIFLTVSAIGIITCILSAIGVKIGNLFGNKFKKTAELAGGCILILLAIKFLLEGLKII